MTREEAIRELKIFNGTTRIRLSANFWEALNVAIKALEQEQKSDWIPISEGLPKIHNRINKYLVTLKDGTVCDALFTECDGNHWWNYNYDDVIAWQELPKAYKENMENKK